MLLLFLLTNFRQLVYIYIWIGSFFCKKITKRSLKFVCVLILGISMLIRFSIENHLSVCDEQEISLVTSTLDGAEDGLLPYNDVPEGSLLPVVIIYGANASGKSNLIDGLSFLKQAVLHSHTKGDPAGGVPRSPFTLDKRQRKKPTVVDLDFVHDDIRYRYGFEATNKAFVGEWLYKYPKGRKQVLFERSGEHEIDFGSSLKGRKKILAEFMRHNSLFLSVAAQNNHEELTVVRDAIASIQFLRSIAISDIDISPKFIEADLDDRVISFLKTLGIGVIGYEKVTSDIPDDVKMFRDALSQAFEKLMQKPHKKSNGDSLVEIQLQHSTVDGEISTLPLQNESSGTRRLLVMMTMVLEALDSGTALVIDELDASLHTMACEEIVKLFSDRKINKKGAQLIATTHDTNLLSSSYLRRDQIWFTQTDSHGRTNVFPLTDISTRKGDNHEKAYLQGRYGAVPFIH